MNSATKTWQDMSTQEILASMAGSVTVSTDPETRQQWVWAGLVGEETPGDGTAACRVLAKRGV